MAGLRIYCDEDSGFLRVVAAARIRGLDIATAHEAGMTHRTDNEQLLFAAGEGRVLYSANVGDFARLHAEWAMSERTHCGLILRTWQQMPIGLQLQGLLAIEAAFDPHSMRGRLIYMTDFLRAAGSGARPGSP